MEARAGHNATRTVILGPETGDGVKLIVAALVGVALMVPLTVQSAAADPLPGLCPDETVVAAPYPVNKWAVVNHPAIQITYLSIFEETNGVAGLQTGPCVTVEGVSAPADVWTGVNIFVPNCVTILGNNICII